MAPCYKITSTIEKGVISLRIFLYVLLVIGVLIVAAGVWQTQYPGFSQVVPRDWFYGGGLLLVISGFGMVVEKKNA